MLCTPNALEWADATSAQCEPLDEGIPAATVPVEHRNAGTHQISKGSYPVGVLLIPTNNDPLTVPAILKVETTEGDSIELTLDPEDPQDMPHGGIALFVS